MSLITNMNVMSIVSPKPNLNILEGNYNDKSGKIWKYLEKYFPNRIV